MAVSLYDEREAMKDSEHILRENEKVLDAHHTTTSLWRRSEGLRLYGVLGAYDMLYLVLASGRNLGPQGMKRAQEGLGQALRWVLGSPSRRIDVEYGLGIDLFQEADEFLRLAADYVDVADLYRMYGRGVARFTVLEDGKLIRFDASEGEDERSEVEGQLELMRGHKSSLPPEEVRKEQRARVSVALSSVSWSLRRGRIRIDNVPSAALESLCRFLQICYPEEPVRLPGDLDLSGFTVEDFDRVSATLQVFAFVLLKAFTRSVKKGQMQAQCMPTQVVDRKRLIAQVARASRLDSQTVTKVVERLTLPVGSDLDPLLLPLISAGGSLAWSPHYFMDYRWERNLLRVMTKTTELKAIADNAIGAREHLLIDLLLALFEKQEYRGKPNCKIHHGAEKGEIDLLLFRPSVPNELLLIEVKAVLAPDEINEVAAVTKELQRAQSQLERCEAILARMSDSAKADILPFVDWEQRPTVYRMVLSIDAEPNTNLDNSATPAISYVVLKASLDETDFSSPRTIVEACRRREWTHELRAGQRDHRRVQFGSVAYELPMLRIDPGSQEGQAHERD